MLFFVLVVCILVAVWLAANFMNNARSNQRYGAGKHTIVINYTKGEPTVYTSYDEGELREWRTSALRDRNVRSATITYANGEQE